MTLKNITSKTILSRDLKQANSFYDLTFGLLRKSNSRSLLFKTRFGIHSFGLKKSIDVVVLDNKFKIVSLRENLKPNSLFFWNPKYNLIIELPSGTLKKTKSFLGCYLELKMV